MSFSKQWEDIFAANKHQSFWPWSDLISMFMRYARPRENRLKVLEIGCGVGANIPFFRSLEDNIDYYAVEGSQSAVNAIHTKYPDLKNRVKCADFTKEVPFSSSDKFDVVVDRAALTSNTTESILNCLKMLKVLLKKDGLFIGIDWYSTKSSQYHKKNTLSDGLSISEFADGMFEGIGIIHFSDRDHIAELFKDYRLEYLCHKTYEQLIPVERADWVS